MRIDRHGHAHRRHAGGTSAARVDRPRAVSRAAARCRHRAAAQLAAGPEQRDKSMPRHGQDAAMPSTRAPRTRPGPVAVVGRPHTHSLPEPFRATPGPGRCARGVGPTSKVSATSPRPRHRSAKSGNPAAAQPRGRGGGGSGQGARGKGRSLAASTRYKAHTVSTHVLGTGSSCPWLPRTAVGCAGPDPAGAAPTARAW